MVTSQPKATSPSTSIPATLAKNLLEDEEQSLAQLCDEQDDLYM